MKSKQEIEASIILNRMVSVFEKWMMETNKNVFQLYELMDKDGSYSMDPSEIQKFLKTIPDGKQFGIKDIKMVHQLLDLNNDGKVSYAEFAKAINEGANAKALTDKNHWAYNIFYRMRKFLSSQKKPFLDFFPNKRKLQGKDMVNASTLIEGLA